jgi:site-specific recombinase XerD
MDGSAGGVIAMVEGAAPLPLVPAERLRAEVDAARGYAANEKAAATRRAYRSDWGIFATWCAARGAVALPAAPETVAAFLAAEADTGAKPSTITRRSAAIRYAHALAGHEPPTAAEAVKTTMRGIRRTHRTAPAQKAPATAERIAMMIAAIPVDTLRGKRDRALILLGFAGAFRRSELVALRVEDITETPDGLRVTIRRSKTDQEGQGHEIAVPRGARLRPVEALRAWLDAAGVAEGPVFRRLVKGGRATADALSAESVADIVKRHAAVAGLDPEQFAGHSLRAGFLTSGAEAGASIFKLMEVSRHRSVDTLRGYVRRAELFKDHAGSAFL